jgi:spermidine synthase
MKPTTRVAETAAPDGAKFVLLKHDGEFLLYMDDRQIMTTTLTHSELLLADIGCDFKKSRRSPRILIGGLGLGYSLRRALEITGPGAQVVVAELLPEIVRWNHEHLDGLNDEILADPRTQIAQEDVFKIINQASGKKGQKFDSILLDVDDGPTSLIQPQNIQLYGSDGLDVIKNALTPGGRLAIWAAVGEPKLLNALGRAGFRTEEIACAKHERAKRQNHRIYLAERKD